MSEKQAVEGDATFAASTSSYVHSGDGVSKIRAKIQSLTATYQQTAAGPDKDVMADQLMHLKNKMGPLLQQAKAAMKSEHDSHRTHMEGVVDPAAAAPVEAAAAPVEAAAPALSMSEKQAVEGDATFAASTSSYVHSGDGVSKIRAKIQSLTATYQQTAAGPDKD